MGLKRRAEPVADPKLITNLELCAFGSITDDADAAGVIAVWEWFRDRYGDTVTWQDYGTGRWSGASNKMWARLPDWLGTEAARKKKPLCSFELHGGASYDSAVPPAFGCLINHSDREYSLRWLAPADETLSDFLDSVRWLAATLPLGWAYGGRGVWGPGYSDATQGRHDAVGDALQADRLLGQAHPILWGTCNEGVCNLGWVTVLGGQQLDAIDGAESKLRALGFDVERAGDALVFVHGDDPRWGDHMTDAYAGAWELIEPVRASAEGLENTWAAGLTLDEMTVWAHRFARSS